MMDIRAMAIVFGTVFLAELGDKTQLATLLFASDRGASPFAVFVAASLALVASTAIAVLAGGIVSQYLNPRLLSYAAGAGFIAIGAWVILRA